MEKKFNGRKIIFVFVIHFSLCVPPDYVWPLPNALCPIWIYLDVLFSTASIMHLCAISLDRYVAIRNPIEHSRFNSRTKAMMKIAAVWTISIGQNATHMYNVSPGTVCNPYVRFDLLRYNFLPPC